MKILVALLLLSCTIYVSGENTKFTNKKTFFLIFHTWCTGYSRQDKYVLRNLYSQLSGYNPNLRKSKALESLAQKHSCVRRHSDHRSTDKKALNLYYNYGAIIACVGGCSEESSNWSRKSPASIFHQYRYKTGHYSQIKNNNLVGCSAAMQSGEWCIFCYLATK